MTNVLNYVLNNPSREFYSELRELYNRVLRIIEAERGNNLDELYSISKTNKRLRDDLGNLSIFDGYPMVEPLSRMDFSERLALLMVMAPHLYPRFYDETFEGYYEAGYIPALFGGVRAPNTGFIPTVETVLTLIVGIYPEARKSLASTLLSASSPFRSLVTLGEAAAGAPEDTRSLIIAPHIIHYLLYGEYGDGTAFPNNPLNGVLPADFPAQEVPTDNVDWGDLVLSTTTSTLVDDVRHWVEQRRMLNTDNGDGSGWNLGSLFKPGYRVLFYGPSGTGKTMTALLLGQLTKRPVYRVDLSMVLSKYIGETEKNLARLFDTLQQNNAQYDDPTVLFFDEADAIFGKRTETRDAHDRFANQEVAYLLQRIEEYDGLVVLASNLKGNIDAAFSRRFQAMIPFPMPTATERGKLWDNMVTKCDGRLDSIDTSSLAARYELSGASIVNVVQFAALRALADGQTYIRTEDLTEGIRLEYQKDGRLL
jgi:hypothetical protein